MRAQKPGVEGRSGTRARQPSRSRQPTPTPSTFEHFSTTATTSLDRLRGAYSARSQAGQSKSALSRWELRAASRVNTAEHRPHGKPRHRARHGAQ
eukprot:5291066-Pyramimonas_sp.AAC.1